MKSHRHQLTLELLLRQFSVCRLPASTAIPQWARRGTIYSITSAADELSIVCESRYVPSDVKSEKGFRCFKLAGPFPFAMTGVLSSVLEPLAKANISIFAISTYDTDYVMVKQKCLGKTMKMLGAAGHKIASDSRR